MNIAAEVQFNTEKPAKISIQKTDVMNIVALGLMKDQLLPRHKTQIPVLLIVLRGSLKFVIRGEEIELSELDTYQIPIDVEHEVRGLSDENLFMLVQEKNAVAK